jgi:hypothetical protein
MCEIVSAPALPAHRHKFSGVSSVSIPAIWSRFRLSSARRTGTDCEHVFMTQTTSVPIVPLFLAKKIHKKTSVGVAAKETFCEKTGPTGTDREKPP